MCDNIEARDVPCWTVGAYFFSYYLVRLFLNVKSDRPWGPQIDVDYVVQMNPLRGSRKALLLGLS